MLLRELKEKEMKTLLDKAKELKTDSKRTEITPEIVELAIAWANNEIGYTQVCKALNYEAKKNGKAYITLARALAHHIRNINH